MMSRGDYPYYEHVTALANRIIGNDGTSAGLRPLSPAATQGILDTDPPEVKIKVYAQATEPTLTKTESMAIWRDTDDSNRIYLIFRRGASDQVKVELT